MTWIDRLLGRTPAEAKREQRASEDDESLKDLRSSFNRVHKRTDQLERELLRVNDELRRKHARRAQ